MREVPEDYYFFNTFSCKVEGFICPRFFITFAISNPKNRNMPSLKEDLSTPKQNLDEFFETAKRVLGQLKNDISNKQLTDNHYLAYSEDNGSKKYVRPINNDFFIWGEEELTQCYSSFLEVIAKVKRRETSYTLEELKNVDSVLYTLQQCMGLGMDLKVEANAAKKLVGTRFEELMRAVFTAAGFANKHLEVLISYGGSEDSYKCENDLVISNGPEVLSDNQHVDPNEIVLSVKTTSKDRLGKMFLDKLLLEKFSRHRVKYVGVFLNDVQRKKETSISSTFTCGLFMVYTKFIKKLDGTYYIAPPKIVSEAPYKRYIHSFSQFLTKDIFTIFDS